MNQIKYRYTGDVLYEYEDGMSLRHALEKATREGAKLCGADLQGADLQGADLCGAKLQGADLYGANLCDAKLQGADLQGANLCDAKLRGAYLQGAYLQGANLCGAEKLIGERPILQVGPIGSRADYLTAYITDQGLRFDAGCQRQITREVFEVLLYETHGDNIHAKEYRAALALIDAHAEIWGAEE